MQEIEVIEKTQDVMGILDMVPEVRDRLLAEHEPGLPASVTVPIIEKLLVITRLMTKSLLPEVNVINGLLILDMTHREFVVGILNGTHEDEVISVPITFPIEVISGGRVKYETNAPTGMTLRPLYIRVASSVTGVMSEGTRTFDVAGLGPEAVEMFYSWACSRGLDDLRRDAPPDFVYPPREDYVTDRRGPIIDSESVALAKTLGAVVSRDFMLPKEIFGSNLGILGYGTFRNALTLGTEYDVPLHVLEERVATMSRDSKITDAVSTEEYRRAVLLKYIHDRLPHPRVAAVMASVGVMTRSSEILGLLKEPERKMITQAIADDEKALEGITNNQCPHRKVVGNLHRAISADDKKAVLEKLDEYIGETTEDMVSCKKCSFPLMCPHTLIHQRAMAEMKNMAEIKSLLSGYIYPDKIEGNFVCRVCGEIIVGISAFDAVVGDISIGYHEREDDPDASALWSEISFLTKYVSFDNLVNRSSFVRSILNLIWPIVSSSNDKISASRGNSLDEIASKKRLNNAIHIFAAFVYFSVISKTTQGPEVVTITLAYPSDTPGTTETAKMLNFAVRTIMDNMAIHVRRAGGLSAQMIGNDILNAYKVISQTKKGAISQVVDSDAGTDLWMVNSFMWYLADHLYGNDGRDNVLRVIDRVAPYKDIEAASKRAIRVRHFVGLVPEPEMRLKMMAQSPEEIISRYTPKSLPHPTKVGGGKKVLSRFQSPLYEATSMVYKAYLEGAMPVMYELMAHAYQNFGDDAARDAYFGMPGVGMLKDYATLAVRLIRYQWCRIVHPIPFKRRYYIPQSATLSMMYTDEGDKRVWVRFGKYSRPAGKKGPWVYEDGYDGPAIASGRPLWMDTTGYLLDGKAKGTSDAAIRAAIIEKEQAANIIGFYEFICPLGDQHDFVGGVCTKCGAHLGGGSKKDRETFVGKYAKKYAADQLMLNPPPAPRAQSDDAMTPAKRKPIAVKPVDFSLLSEAAKYCNVPPNVIASIGAFDGVSYKSIVDGTYHAPVITSRLSLRPDRLRTACITLISKYGSFVNIANDHRPLKEILDVIGDIRVPRGIMSLRDFADNFVNDYNDVFNNNSPKDLVDFALGRFVTMILKLKAIEAAHKEVRSVIAWVVSSALSEERLATKPVITSWASIIKAQKDENDTNNDDDAGASREGEDDDEDGDGMDVDEEEGENDGSNQIKLKDE